MKVYKYSGCYNHISYGNIPLIKYDDLQKDNYRYLDYDPVHKVDLYERIKNKVIAVGTEGGY